MDIEDYLSDLMEHGAADALAGVDVDAILHEGERLGMRLHRRRRNRIALGTAAAVVALGAGTVTAIAAVGSHSAGTEAASRATHTTLRTAAPASKASPTPTPTPPVTHQRPITYQDVVTRFAKLVPAGVTVSLDPTTPLALQTTKFTNLRMDDGHGAAVVFVGITGPVGAGSAGASGSVDASGDAYASGGADVSGTGAAQCPATWTGVDEGPRPAGALPAGCSSETLADGDRLMNVVTADDGYGYYDIEVTLTRRDGVTVTVTIGNGVLGTKPPVTVTRARPPLSVTQVDELVRSPLWQTSVTVAGPA